MVDYTEGGGYQYHIGAKPGEIGDYVILPGDPKRVKKIAAHLKNAKQVADSREFLTYTGLLDEKRVSVTSTGIGGPSAVIALEELVKSGARTFIRVGTCGGIALDVQGGDLVIATGSVRAEGTSLEYAPIEYPAVANFEIVDALRKAAERLRLKSHTGVVQCKDSFYGQHDPDASPVSYMLKNKWEAYKKLGVLASEMESSALFVAAASLGVRVGTVLLTVANQERAAEGLPNEQVHDTDDAIRCAIEAIRGL